MPDSADKRLTDFDELTAVADDDFMHVVDVSDTTDDPAGTSYKAQVSNIRSIAKTQAEIDADVTITNFLYDPGNAFRYGARANGIADDYDALHALKDVINEQGGGDVVYPPGEYLIDRYEITTPPNGNTFIEFADCDGLNIQAYGALFNLKGDFHRDTNAEDRVILPFVFTRCTRVVAAGFEVDGNVDQMTRDGGVTEAFAHGVALLGCSQVDLRDIYVHHMQSDGFYFASDLVGSLATPTVGVHCTNCRSRFNARQGISLIEARNLTFDVCVFSDTGTAAGTYSHHAPAAGVDIEPNRNAAPDWVADTYYILGDYSLNDSGKVYQLMTAGTSASSGGPTGTGSGITDGDAVWDFSGTTYMDERDASIRFNSCKIKNNVGTILSAIGAARNVVFDTCDLSVGEQTPSRAIILAVQLGKIINCHIDCGAALFYPVWNVSKFEATTYITHNTILASARSLIVDGGGDRGSSKAVIRHNKIFITATAPFTGTSFIFLRSDDSVFTDNYVFIPQAAHNAAGGDLALHLENLAECARNTYETDLDTAGKHWYNSYTNAQLVEAEDYTRNAGAENFWRPSLNAAFDISYKFTAGTTYAGRKLQFAVTTSDAFPVSMIFSAAMPATGDYIAGDIAFNTGVSFDGSGMHILGWKRLVTGSAHVAGTDWEIMYVSKNSPAT
ncbi:MAG: hypothetical protein V3U60_11175 [Gammaproteobacteria bacterium]